MNFLRRSPGVVHKQRRSLDSTAVQYNSSQESLSVGKDDSAEENREDGQRRSSFSGKVPTIQEGDENKNERRGSFGFEILQDGHTDDESVDAANRNTLLLNGLSGEDSSALNNNDNLSDNNAPTRGHHKHRHCSHHYHHYNRDNADSENKNNGTDQFSSDNREGNTPDRFLGTPDVAEGVKSRAREMSFDKSFEHLVEKLSEKPADSISQSSGGRAESKSTASNGGSDCETATKISSDDIVVTVTKSSKPKKRSSALFSVLSPTYKSRSEDFKKFFKDVPTDERLIVDYSCAIQKDILVHGRLFITQNWVCFYANIFRWETVLTIPCKEITAITKEKTARVIPNAIQITTQKEKYFFTSFAARDKTFLMLFRIWQNALLDQPMTPKELWHWVHYCYGEELGLTSSDEDYVPLPIASNSLMDKLKDESHNNAVKSLYPTGMLGKTLNWLGEEFIVLETDSTTETSVANGDLDSSATPARSPDSICDQSEAVMNSTPGILGVSGDPTDCGDTTEDSEGIGEVLCTGVPGHEHFDKIYMNEVFNLSIDKVFDLIFSDSKFFKDFVGDNKTFDLDLPAWQDETEEDKSRFRLIKYTLTLGAAFGPKHSPTTEKQFCLEQSKPGSVYIIDCHIANGGIPYADSFYTINRYCLTRIAQNRCRIKVTSEVKYRKSVWALVKSMIEKNAHHGITKYYENLSISLHKEAGKQEHLTSFKQPSKKKRRRRRLLVSNSDSHIPARQAEVVLTPPSPIRSFSLGEDTLMKLNADTLVRIIVFVLILLVMFNAVLFYKLWALEGFADGSHSPFSKFRPAKLESYPKSQEEWVKLLQQQQMLHHSEIDHWREILSTSVLLMDQMKVTLMELKMSLDHHYANITSDQTPGQDVHSDEQTHTQADVPSHTDKMVKS